MPNVKPNPNRRQISRQERQYQDNIATQVSDDGQIFVTQLNFTGANINLFPTRLHADLQSIGEADETSAELTKDKHVSNNQLKVLYDRTNSATLTVAGIVKLAALIANHAAATAAAASASGVSVTSADATDLASVITLANELKGDVNTLVSDLNAVVTEFNKSVTDLGTIITKINDVLAGQKTAGQMSTT